MPKFLVEDAYQQVGDVVESDDLDIHDLENVDNEGEDVADEEDKDDDHEHRRKPDLFLLQAGQAGPLGVGPTNLQEKRSNL